MDESTLRTEASQQESALDRIEAVPDAVVKRESTLRTEASRQESALDRIEAVPDAVVKRSTVRTKLDHYIAQVLKTPAKLL